MGNNGEDWRNNIIWLIYIHYKKFFFFSNVSPIKAEAQRSFFRQATLVPDDSPLCGWGSQWALTGHVSANQMEMENTLLFQLTLVNCIFLVDF